MNPYRARVRADAALLLLLLVGSVALAGTREGSVLLAIGVALALLVFGKLCNDVAARKAWAALERGEGLLSHWTYADDEWQQFLVVDRARIGADSGSWSVTTLVAAVVLAASAWAAWTFEWRGLAVTFGILCLTALWLAIDAVVRLLRSHLDSAPVAWIGRNAVAFRGALVEFRGDMSRLVGVECDEEWLEISWRSLMRHRIGVRVLRIPVPRGREGEAVQIAAALRPGRG